MRDKVTYKDVKQVSRLKGDLSRKQAFLIGSSAVTAKVQALEDQ